MKTALVLAFIVSFGFAKEPPKEDPAKKVIEKLQGEWIVDHAGRIRIKDFYGIYLLDGDTLKVCFKDQPGSDKQDEVPTAFDTNMGADWYLFVFKREKK